MNPQSISTADLKRSLDSAVRKYETAIMRQPTDEGEIRECVERCAAARRRYKEAIAANKQPRAE